MNPGVPDNIWALFIETRVQEWSEPRAELTHPRGALRAATELAYEGSKSAPVRALANHVLRACPSASEAPICLAAWIRAHLTYRMETPGVEVLAGPISTVRSGGGDCDDLSILFAALAQAVGLRAYPTSMWRDGGWAHMVGLCPPHPPIELSIDTFYSGVQRIPRFVGVEPGDRFLCYSIRQDRFFDPAPSSGSKRCPTC